MLIAHYRGYMISTLNTSQGQLGIWADVDLIDRVDDLHEAKTVIDGWMEAR